jgi:hypothetical protein
VLRRVVHLAPSRRERRPGQHHRAHGGEHSLANVATLCWFHHRLVHEGGWSLALDLLSGEYVATNPSGLELRGSAADLDGSPDALRLANEDEGHSIDATTPIAKWGGEGLDLGWAVTSLWYSNHREELTRFADQAARCRGAAA